MKFFVKKVIKIFMRTIYTIQFHYIAMPILTTIIPLINEYEVYLYSSGFSLFLQDFIVLIVEAFNLFG
jgi:hypothetical protein